MAIITFKGMLRIKETCTVMCMVRIIIKGTVKVMVIIKVRGMVVIITDKGTV